MHALCFFPRLRNDTHSFGSRGSRNLHVYVLTKGILKSRHRFFFRPHLFLQIFRRGQAEPCGKCSCGGKKKLGAGGQCDDIWRLCCGRRFYVVVDMTSVCLRWRISYYQSHACCRHCPAQRLPLKIFIIHNVPVDRLSGLHYQIHA